MQNFASAFGGKEILSRSVLRNTAQEILCIVFIGSCFDGKTNDDAVRTINLE